MLEALALLGGSGAASLYSGAEITRQRPRLNNSKRALPKLDRGYEQRIDQIAPGRSKDYGIAFHEPPLTKGPIERFNQIRQNTSQYSSSTAPHRPEPGVNINPHADRVYLAHEMGHLASQQTDLGHLTASLRANPKLKTALLGAMVTLPGVAAALESGEDDLDSSLALAMVANAPTLVDEVLASKNGLAIMDNAGLRASLGQRGKLAGGLLSYMAVPLVAGVAGNMVGNQFDTDPAQTAGTLNG